MNKRYLYILFSLYAVSIVCALLLVTLRPKRVSDKHSFNLPMELKHTSASIAVIEIYGAIYFSDRPSRFGLMSGADSIVSRLAKINKKKEIKAVVLRINSPGGSVAACQEICDEIKKLRANGKIVVASMGDVAASGGYYIASQSDRIIANPGTLTGSIGVIMQTAQVQELLKKVGVKIETFRSGKYKDIGSPFRDFTPEERKILENIINDSYNQFVDAISEGRKMKREDVLEVATGNIFTGAQALNLKLIDELGNFEHAVKVAKELAGIKGEPVIIRDIDTFGNFFSLFGEKSELQILNKIVGSRKVRLDFIME